jgi:peptidylprolyl isomerase
MPVVAVAVALISLAACGDSKDNASSDTTTATTTAPSGSTTTTVPETTTTAPVTVPSPTFAKPTVSIPAAAPTELKITDLTVGTGPKAADLDLVVVNYVGVRSRDGVEFDSSYGEGKQPLKVNLGAGGVIKGWEQGLQGVQAGGRRQLDIPSDLAYGATPPGGDVIGPNENLTFVIDVLAVVSPTNATDQPALVIPPSAAQTDTTTVDLVVGDGAEAQQGDRVILNFILFRADTGEQFYSSWGDSQALTPITLNPGTSIDGILEAVYGMKVGGRRQMHVPFAKVFDGKGQESLQLPAATDVIAIVDLRAAY